VADPLGLEALDEQVRGTAGGHRAHASSVPASVREDAGGAARGRLRPAQPPL
jgi:hypothetical protein